MLYLYHSYAMLVSEPTFSSSTLATVAFESARRAFHVNGAGRYPTTILEIHRKRGYVPQSLGLRRFRLDPDPSPAAVFTWRVILRAPLGH